ncbi:hypothetical protein [Rosistilla carotiformis]|nr:hypothetical protein [Rosistilla carotiformis]
MRCHADRLPLSSEAAAVIETSVARRIELNCGERMSLPDRIS